MSLVVKDFDEGSVGSAESNEEHEVHSCNHDVEETCNGHESACCGHDHDHKHSKSPEKGSSVAYITMVYLTGLFFVVELLAGYIFSSLALISDAMHMLLDFSALILALSFKKISLRPRSSSNTYGFQRGEVIGGLCNGVVMLTLSFFITLESFEKILGGDEHGTEVGIPLMTVATIGLFINIIGIKLFHGEIHQDCDHSHGGHSHSHGHGEKCNHDHGNSEKNKDDVDLNAMGALLHIIGDLLGSIAVLISGAIIYWTDWKYKHLADPIASLMIAIFMVFSATPMVKKAIAILLQSTPTSIDSKKIKEKLMEIPDIVGVHDLHIWSLVRSTIVCSAHVTVVDSADWNSVATVAKRMLHDVGVHSTTLQPEFVQLQEGVTLNFDDCSFRCCEKAKACCQKHE
ncbi:hypothetical protein PCE1_003215 [Barthelona sp. PCE]